jgi:hypothetical protein
VGSVTLPESEAAPAVTEPFTTELTQAEPESGAIAQSVGSIPAEDLDELAQMGVPIVVPSALLAQAEYSGLVVVADDPYYQDYTLYYRMFSEDSALATCFQIEYSSGGFGGPLPMNQRAIAPLAIAAPGQDYFVYWTGDEPPSDDSPFPSNTVFSDWIEMPGVEGGYRLSSGLIETELVRACNPLDPDTAVALVESLEVLNP